MRSTLVVIAAALLSACAVGPDYRAPDTAATPFVAAQGAGVNEQPFEAAWWEQFRDPTLDGLIERALTDDLDLRIALARVEEARAFLGAARRDRWPAVSTEIARTESRQQQPGLSTERVDVESYDAGFATLWELDLFGRVRRGVEAATADADAAVAGLRDAQVLVAAEVARNYVELRGAQKRLAVARANLGYQQETLELTRVRLELGRGSELDVASAAARRAATEATIPPLVAAETIAANRLAVLLGERPGALNAELAPREIAPHLTTIAVDSPAALLQRRPDIRAAERELAAATARIGVAKADLFPRLSLSGFIGFVAGDADELGESRAVLGASRRCCRGPDSTAARTHESRRTRRAPQRRSRATSSRCCARSRRPRTRSSRTARIGSGSKPSWSKRRRRARRPSSRAFSIAKARSISCGCSTRSARCCKPRTRSRLRRRISTRRSC